MTYDQVFTLLNFSVVPAWAMLIFLPRAKLTERLVHSALYPIVLGLFYMIGFGLILTGFGGAADVSFSSVADISAAFSTPIGVLVGWSHYLVFDLFVGAWIGRDAQRRSITHWLVAPALFFTFVLGPIGLLIYVCGRLLLRRTTMLSEEAG
ncbi:MAG: ABA4-like family protein [Pseudomonadota bacterium]